MITKLSAASWPTTVVMIDDENTFLRQSQFQLNEWRCYKSFSSPKKAVTFLTTEYVSPSLSSTCIEYTEDDEGSAEERQLNIDVRKIQDIVHYPERFEEIAVVISDFSMPGMDGAAVAQALRALPFKIILLTGQGNHELATQLFNQGLIQGFVRKGSPDVYVQLKKMVLELETSYFQQQSSMVVDAIIQKSQRVDYIPLSCLDDATFIDYFQRILNEHQIVEYYLIETSGSFLLLDADGEPSWLLVKDLGDIAALDDTLRFDHDTVSEHIIKQVKNREVIMHVFAGELLTDKEGAWQHFLYPATKISGKSDYFCSVVTGKEALSHLDGEAILSYSHYLAQK